MKIREIRSSSTSSRESFRRVSKRRAARDQKPNNGRKPVVMSFKQMCAVCEPTFLDQLLQIKENFKHAIRSHLIKMKDEVHDIIAVRKPTECCRLCEPVLSSESKKVYNHYCQMIHDKFCEMLEECDTILNMKLRKTYPFKYTGK